MQCFGWPSQFRAKRGKQCTIPRERSIIRSSCSIWANPHKKWENCMDWAIPNPERKNVIPWCSIWVNPHNRAKKGGNYRERIIQGKKYKIVIKLTFFYLACSIFVTTGWKRGKLYELSKLPFLNRRSLFQLCSHQNQAIAKEQLSNSKPCNLNI